MLIWATLSNAFGRCKIFLLAILTFGIGAIVCAVASTWPALLAGRAIQGAGGGGILSLTTILITDLAPLRDRGRLYALISAVWAVGSTSGPVIGGALSQSGAWRWIFWINLPILAVSAAGVGMFLQLSQRQRNLAESLQLFDFSGTALFMLAITSLLLAVTWGGSLYPWSSWRTVLPLTLGGTGIIAFGLLNFSVFTSTTNASRLIPRQAMANTSTIICYAGSVFHGMILYSLIYYMPEYFQAVRLYTPLIAGVAALPQTIAVVPCAILVGAVVSHTGQYRWAIWAGWILTCFGCGLLVLLDETTTVPQWIFLEAVSGLGLGFLFPSITLAVQSSTPLAQSGIAATLVIFFRSIGQACGVAVGGAILSNRLQSSLGNNPNVPSDPITTMQLLQYLPIDDPVALLLRKELVKAFRFIWVVMCGFAGCCFLISVRIREYNIN